MENIEKFYSLKKFDNLQEELNLKKDEIRRKGLLFYVTLALKSYCGGARNILDVGGGSGVNLSIYGQEINCSELYSVDLREPELKIPGVHYVHSAIEKLNSLNLPMFDCIVMTEVIEHIFDPDTVVKQVIDKLNDNGILIITTPNLSGLVNVLTLAFNYQPVDTEVSASRTYGRPFVRSGETVGHIRVFTLRALEELMGYYNMRILRSGTVGRITSSKYRGSIPIRLANIVDRLASKLIKFGGSRSYIVTQKME
ncbi:MAG: class I SAM-dependent methyltransferase [Thermoplasmatales archaeon]